MPISTTLRQLDGDIWINADGLRTDRNGIPITGTGSGVTIAPGVVNPEGVVVASPGATYRNTANDTFWSKDTGTGNTGCIQLI